MVAGAVAITVLGATLGMATSTAAHTDYWDYNEGHSNIPYADHNDHYNGHAEYHDHICMENPIER